MKAPSKTALFAAARAWDAAAVERMLAVAPALASAADRLKRLKTLELLIEAGADAGTRDRQGRDAADIARARCLPKDAVARLEVSRRTEVRR